MELADLEGLIPAEVGEALANYAAWVSSDLAIVEVGSYKGKSTCYLAAGAKRGSGAHVYAVDAWDLAGNVTGRFGFAHPSTREAFERQVRAMRLWSCVTPVRGFSVDVASTWDRPVGLLYIDADHAEGSVRSDFMAWERHLVPGGMVIFDDLDTPKNPGVRAVVDGLGTFDFRVEAGRLAVGTRR